MHQCTTGDNQIIDPPSHRDYIGNYIDTPFGCLLQEFTGSDEIEEAENPQYLQLYLFFSLPS